MIRRKLCVYTLLYIAGITAGYFMWEKMRAGIAVAFLISTCITVMFLEPETECSKRGRAIMVCIVLSGFLLFTIRFASYAATVSKHVTNNRSHLYGEVIAVKPDDGRLVLNVRSHGSNNKTGMLGSEDVQVRVVVNSYAYDDMPPYDLIGSIIDADGKYEEINRRENPGCFDYRLYMKSNSVCLSFKADDVNVLGEDKAIIVLIKRFMIRTRERFLSNFNDRSAAFLRGTVFGDKSQIDETVLDEFSLNSTGHILAVSGLHVGFLYTLLRLLTGRKKNITAVIITIIVILLYGEMTVWSSSTIRAVIVMILSLLAPHLRRRSDLLTSVSAAAVVILTYQPYQLFNTGFQMTFVALTGIAFLTGPLAHYMDEGFAMLIAVQLSVAPLTAWTFNHFNVLSILINIPIVTLAAVLIPGCICIVYVYMIVGWIPTFIFRLIDYMADSLIRINGLLSFKGDFANNLANHNAGWLLLYYFTLFMIASEWMRIRMLRKEWKRALSVFLCCAISISIFGAAAFNEFCDDEIVFVSVGQGDCTHLRYGGKDIIIDGGGNTERNIGKDVLMPYLLSNGVNDIDLALVTHLHTDHYLGIAQLAEVFPVSAVGIPFMYRRAVESHKSEDPEEDLIIPESAILIDFSQRIQLNKDVYIDAIWPAEQADDTLSIDDPNENNMVYMINYNGIKTIVTGDLLEQDEIDMVDYYRGTDVLDCDVLKVAHHGSKSSTSEEFLDAVSPDIAVIQVGKNNFYGHPHQQTLDRLENRGIKVYRTDVNGAVGIDITKRGIKVDLIEL